MELSAKIVCKMDSRTELPVFCPQPTSSYLLRVKVLKRKRKSCEGPDEVKLKTEIVAPIGVTFKFHNLCDFQFLPAFRTPVRLTPELERGFLTRFKGSELASRTSPSGC
jgi:hypothetical protein